MNNTQCCSHCDTVLLWIPKAVRIELKCEQVKMDVEIGKDDISSEDGRLVVFGDLCSDVRYGFKGRFPWRRKTSYEDQVILNAACGALRPGRLTFILGPSGAGKTTLMTILAGRKKTGVSGCLLGVGREAVLVSQQATLLDVLTGRETLQFAAALKLPDLSRRDRLYAVENVSRQLGIQDALNTKAGDMSGGERKRLNIACELLTDPMVMLLDEPTSGLDSVSSMSVIRALHSVARGGRTVACVVHQPASKLYSSADDVILLANGRTLYAGAVEDAPATFQRAGFHCPQYYNMADFILEVASGEHAGNLALLENEARSYAHEMRKIAHNEVSGNNGKLIVPVPEAEALLQSPKAAAAAAAYPAGVWLQLRALLWRCSVGSLRDVYLSQARLACHLLVALLLGALYAGAGEDGARVTTNTSCLFFFLLFLFFSNAMPTIQTFPAEASVVVQEHLNRWYSLTAYCISKIVSDLPLQLLCATIFMVPAWVLTSQPFELHRMALMWAVSILITILAQTSGLVVGAACGVKLGLFVVPAANIPMLMFSEFFIPYNEMPVYLRPLAHISYFRYAFDAAIQTVYGFNRETLPCYQPYCMFKHPDKFLKHLGLNTQFQTDIYALCIWIVLLQFALMCVLTFRIHRACR
ncbi:ATP-binding cassette sub-family G member 4 isoform X1 [Plutella xylostella]|uniref:ATP-binding cassette sub-family G member 4 isoform X1 n=1 Tax=Plutella xylostella TaxID=51655 RepID=UPI0020330B3F|nr:ATP-binding cassette sub-family G member 4 isoform X1 [Plutella xylostella]